MRPQPEYFAVGYYGLGFPSFLRVRKWSSIYYKYTKTCTVLMLRSGFRKHVMCNNVDKADWLFDETAMCTPRLFWKISLIVILAFCCVSLVVRSLECSATEQDVHLPRQGVRVARRLQPKAALSVPQRRADDQHSAPWRWHQQLHWTVYPSRNVIRHTKAICLSSYVCSIAAGNAAMWTFVMLCSILWQLLDSLSYISNTRPCPKYLQPFIQCHHQADIYLSDALTFSRNNYVPNIFKVWLLLIDKC